MTVSLPTVPTAATTAPPAGSTNTGPATPAASRNVDALKLARLQAAARAGSEGVAQFDAAQNSVGQQRAAQAAGLAADARSAGYAGPTVGGAPSVLSGALHAGLSPYEQALASGKANFTQDIAQGLAASEAYLKEAQAAPPVRSGSGGGGGGGGSSKPISNTALLADLKGVAAQLRAQQLAAINLTGQKTEAAADTTAIQQGGLANRLAEYKRFEDPRTVPALPRPINTRGRPGTPGAPARPTPIDAAPSSNPITPQIDASNRRYMGFKDLAERVLPQQFQKAYFTTPSQEIAGSPEIMAQLAAAGLADRVPQVLTPSVDKTWLTATQGLLPKAAAVAAKPAGKPLPVPYTDAAKAAGIPPQGVSTLLGTVYLKGGYAPAKNDKGQFIDSNGQVTKTPSYYVNSTGTKVSPRGATGNLVDDIMSAASEKAKAGYDPASFIAWLTADPNFGQFVPADNVPLARYTQPQLALALALSASRGFFSPSPAVPGIAAHPIPPSVGYQIPDVRSGG